MPFDLTVGSLTKGYSGARRRLADHFLQLTHYSLRQTVISAILRMRRHAVARLVHTLGKSWRRWTGSCRPLDGDPTLEILDRMARDEYSIALVLTIQLGAPRRGLAGEDLALA